MDHKSNSNVLLKLIKFVYNYKTYITIIMFTYAQMALMFAS